MVFQSGYEVNLPRGYVGALAEDASPWQIDRVPAQVPDSGRKPRPGDQVYWDATNKGAAAVASADNQKAAFGIVTYFPGILPKLLDSAPSGANSRVFVEYEDGQFMPVIVMGTAWLLAGAALVYGDQIVQHTADRDWVKGDNVQPTAVANILRAAVRCADLAVADGAIFKGRIGTGGIY